MTPLDKTAPAPQTAWHTLSDRDTLARVESSEAGLSDEEAAQRLARFGTNALNTTEGRSPLRILLGQFTNVMILILIGAAVISGFIGDLKDTIVIGAILCLNGAIGFIQEYRAERALEALQKMAAPFATVHRSGLAKSVPASTVVPGDIVLLEAGGIVPADLRLLEGAALRTDESALTGESQPVEKHTDPVSDESDGMTPLADRSNMAYMGTFVSHGRGRGVTVATSAATELGQIATLLRTAESSRTPLERRLERFGRHLAAGALAAAAAIFILGALRGEPPLLMLLTAISLAVAAIPEALPAVVTISLAIGARRLVRENVLVRKLAAVEALGSVTVICSDKTGTLTQNRMSVELLHCDGRSHRTALTGPAWTRLLQAMALNNDVRIDANGGAMGDPTEVALFQAAERAGFEKEVLEERFSRIAELPFDSERKRMTTIHRDPEGGFLIFTKGAVETVIPQCALQLTDSASVPLDGGEVDRTTDTMAERGLRVLAFAFRRHNANDFSLAPDEVETGLTFLGLAGIGDPIREEAAEAVKTCREAGIATVMITGDHPTTARAIAHDLGILGGAPGTHELLTGRELTALSEDELLRRIDNTRVYARVAPEQKLRIVSALQARGHLVAMTGDGVNDAPALKKAEIGVSMGITGTDVAKQASSLILLDDNFATIVRAVREGRRIYDNLRRFVRYAVTTNSSEILIMFAAPLAGLPMPLLPLQILWVNLVTDGLPGLAIAAEPEETNVMHRKPRAPEESIFANGLGAHVIWVGLLMAALALGTQVVALRSGTPAWQTIVVTVIAFSQLAHVLAIRSETESLFRLGLGSNKPLLGAVAATILLQLAVIYVPLLNRLFATQPLAAVELGAAFLPAAVVLLAVETEKWIRRRRGGLR